MRIPWKPNPEDYPRDGWMATIRQVLLVLWAGVTVEAGWYFGNVGNYINGHLKTLPDLASWKLWGPALASPVTPYIQHIHPIVVGLAIGVNLALIVGCLWAAVDRKWQDDAEKEVIAATSKLLRDESIGTIETKRFEFAPPHDQLSAPGMFVGRDDELAWMLARLQLGPMEGSTILWGLDGLGKTTLAAEAILRLSNQQLFPDGIAVVQGDGLKDVLAVLGRIVEHFDRTHRAWLIHNLERLKDFIAHMLGNKRALIVLDNLDPALSIAEIVPPLRDAGLTVLLTSTQDSDVMNPASSRQLQGLSLDDALEIFARNYGKNSRSELTPAERDAALSIIMDVDRHTLAIQQAALSLRRSKRDPKSYAEELRADVAGKLPGVQAVLAKSVQQLPPDVIAMFAALSLFRTREFGRRAAIAVGMGLNIAHPDQCIDTLVGADLLDVPQSSLTTPADHERLQMHRLLVPIARQAFMRLSHAKQQKLNAALTNWYISYVQSVPPAALEQDEGNITGAIAWAHEHQLVQAVELSYSLGIFWRQKGRTDSILEQLPPILSSAEALRRHPQLLWARMGGLGLLIGQAYYITGDLNEAEATLVKARAAFQHAKDRVDEAMCLTELGYIEQTRQHLPQAEAIYQQALEIQQSAKNQDGISEVLFALGQLAHDRGLLHRAEAIFRRVLALDRTLENGENEGTDLGEIGQIVMERGDLAQAQAAFDEALQIHQAGGRGVHRREEGTDLLHLGQLARIKGDLLQAQNYVQQALEIHQDTKFTRGQGVDIEEMGKIALARKDFTAAKAFFERALALHRRSQDIRQVCLDLLLLGQWERAYGSLSEAEARIKEALAYAQDPRRKAELTLEQARIAFARGDLLRALHIAADIRTVYHQAGNLQGELAAILVLQDIAEKQGDTMSLTSLQSEENALRSLIDHG
jgi:tetratricopeptide (TPR) repeat protein